MGIEKSKKKKRIFSIFLKIFFTIIVLIISYFIGAYTLLFAGLLSINFFIALPSLLILPGLLIPQIWLKRSNKKIALIIWCAFVGIILILLGIFYINRVNDERFKIMTDNINVYEYMPFDKKSKIAVLDDESSLKFKENDGTLPIVDGAAALFPVYSSFINAVYPSNISTELSHREEDKNEYNVFRYNNTTNGYKALTDGETDIFFGVFPSEQDLNYAELNDVEFEYIPIGYEGFVFLVNAKNKVNGLSSQQIKDIYSGKITNWRELGGKNKTIIAYQRNENSGSQSMMRKFMNSQKLMVAPTEQVQMFMDGLVTVVSDYRNKDKAIGYSFRYYVQGILDNKGVKLLEVDGISPTYENIQNGSYPIITPFYAVIRKGENKEKVDELITWILSEQGQELIKKSGYVGV